MKMQSFCVTLSAATILLSTVFATQPKSVDDNQKLAEYYRGIRKDYFMVLAIPAHSAGNLRPEHRRFLSKTTSFLKQTQAAPLYQAGTLYFRGRLLLHLRLLPAARKDFDACAKLIADLPDHATLTGLPNRTTVQILRAVTYADEGNDHLLELLEEIPQDAPDPAYHEVGNLITRWADGLADNERYDQALRAYKFIQRFNLWADEGDNPRRKIELLTLQQQNSTR